MTLGLVLNRSTRSFKDAHPWVGPKVATHPQLPFYCGVGSDEVFGRQMVEDHLELCIKAGLMIYGINAEVMPGHGYE